MTSFKRLLALTATLALGFGGTASTAAALEPGPTLSLSEPGHVLHWTEVPGTTQYTLTENPKEIGLKTKTIRLLGSEFEYPADCVAGQELVYKVKESLPVKSKPSNSITVSWPTPCPEPEKEPPVEETRLIGFDGESYAAGEVEKLKASKLLPERIEAGGPYLTLKASTEKGFGPDTVIVGNSPDGSKLSSLNLETLANEAYNQIKEDEAIGNVAFYSLGNEDYLKGGQAEPALYADLYEKVIAKKNAGGYKAVPLCFQGFGDYKRPNGTWSQVASGGGWIGDAIAAKPGLKASIECWDYHAYGRAGENKENDWGTTVVQVWHDQAAALGVVELDAYITETGIQYIAGSEGPIVAPTEAKQAEFIKGDYDYFTSLPFIKGIWYYQLHDDGTGHFGLLQKNEPNSPIRPSYNTVAGFVGSKIKGGAASPLDAVPF